MHSLPWRTIIPPLGACLWAIYPVPTVLQLYLDHAILIYLQLHNEESFGRMCACVMCVRGFLSIMGGGGGGGTFLE